MSKSYAHKHELVKGTHKIHGEFTVCFLCMWCDNENFKMEELADLCEYLNEMNRQEEMRKINLRARLPIENKIPQTDLDAKSDKDPKAEADKD